MQDVHLSNWTETGGTNFLSRATHRAWLLSQATALLDFYRPNVLNPAGGFHVLDDDGGPLPAGSAQNGAERQLHDTTRMVHCFAMAKLWGQSGVDDVIDHGMDLLWTRHRDAAHGGYFWGVDDSGPTNPAKQAYGHAFVMLAAASAKAADHPDADRLLADVSEVLQARFWEESCGAAREEYSADWQVTSDYRGQNSNMHLTEALMAAYEVTGEQSYLGMAQRIAGLIVNRHARHQDWRIAEHFDRHWQVDREYAGNPVFRPRGITPGHALEWSRLLIQLWELGARQQAWLPDAAKRLFFNAIETGWNAQTGGFYYTLDWNNTPDQADRFWWPCAEGIAAAA
uniref:AGE family epimerase/isomerase n=1 Tax=Candidatus Halocynthiibacter alkanivorans TaxID=2267619 RepID=UPI000DF20D4E